MNHSVHMEIRKQHVRVSSLLSLCRFRELNLSFLTWQQVPLPAEPSHHPVILKSLIDSTYNTHMRSCAMCDRHANMWIQGSLWIQGPTQMSLVAELPSLSQSLFLALISLHSLYGSYRSCFLQDSTLTLANECLCVWQSIRWSEKPFGAAVMLHC